MKSLYASLKAQKGRLRYHPAVAVRTSAQHTERMATPQFIRQAAHLAKTLEARGPAFSPSSTAAISVSQLEQPLTSRVFLHLTTELSNLLRAVSEEPLSLTEARALYGSQLTDTLCSILGRLPWKDFCNDTDSLTTHGKGFMLGGCAIDCLHGLLQTAHRVQQSNDAARLEIYGRYVFCMAEEEVVCL